jgi:hypothetical protein
LDAALAAKKSEKFVQSFFIPAANKKKKEKENKKRFGAKLKIVSLKGHSGQEQ